MSCAFSLATAFESGTVNVAVSGVVRDSVPRRNDRSRSFWQCPNHTQFAGQIEGLMNQPQAVPGIFTSAMAPALLSTAATLASPLAHPLALPPGHPPTHPPVPTPTQPVATGSVNGSHSHDSQGDDNFAASLGPSLEPALRDACALSGCNLERIYWFKSRWQRGGASTGSVNIITPDGFKHQAVVKVPVGYKEYKWTIGLSARAQPAEMHQHPTPLIFAHGTEVGSHDLCWLVMEKLPSHPLAHGMAETDVQDMMAATAAMQAAAIAHQPVSGQPPSPNWERVIEKSRECIRRGRIDNAQHWLNAFKAVHRCLPSLTLKWQERPINAWCHGDLHPGNAMRRGAAPGSGRPGQCVLIDLALIHPGHWIEDALYFERVYWGQSNLIHNVNLVSALSAARRSLGLAATGDYGMLASVRRVRMATAAPGLVEREGNPKYLEYALSLIDRLLPAVGH